MKIFELMTFLICKNIDLKKKILKNKAPLIILNKYYILMNFMRFVLNFRNRYFNDQKLSKRKYLGF